MRTYVVPVTCCLAIQGFWLACVTGLDRLLSDRTQTIPNPALILSMQGSGQDEESRLPGS